MRRVLSPLLLLCAMVCLAVAAAAEPSEPEFEFFAEDMERHNEAGSGRYSVDISRAWAIEGRAVKGGLVVQQASYADAV